MIATRIALAAVVLTGCDAVFGLREVPAFVPVDMMIDAPIRIGWKATATGEHFSCGIRADDTLWCWGYNTNHEIGVGSPAAAILEPTRVGGDRLFAQVSATYVHACAVTLDRELFCWGWNAYGQLGTGNSDDGLTPQQVPGRWKQVATGAYATCAIADDDSLWCWGLNTYGELGVGAIGRTMPVPEQVSAEAWRTVDAGWYHSCGIKADSSLWCWGYGSDGALGNGGYASASVPTEVPGEAWVDIAVGGRSSCGITTGGALRCWGADSAGQVGNGSDPGTPSPAPVLVDGVEAEDWQRISIDDATACAVRADASMWCWGKGNHAQNGTDDDAPSPVRFTQGSMQWRRVDTSRDHTCAVDFDNHLYCWGAGGRGQLGDGTSAHARPSLMPGTYSMLDAEAYMTCGLDATTTQPHCAGLNEYGQLGDGTTRDRQVMTPIAAAAMTYLDVTAGTQHACATSTASTLCWGFNGYGALGDATTTSRPTPQPIIGYVSEITANGQTCGISAGIIYCWGYNIYGQVGNGTTTNATTAFQAGSGPAVSAGYAHTCAINSSNAGYCWGRGYEGQLGTGAAANATIATAVVATNTGTLASISSGSYHTCAIATDGRLWCWGYNANGQLGRGDRAAAYTPVQVGTGLWKAVAAGDSHTCAIAMDGSLWCWGANHRAQLGLGTYVDRHVPGQVGSDVDWLDVTAGYYHTCARKTDGTSWCWGNNDFGQIFDATAWRSTPVMVP